MKVFTDRKIKLLFRRMLASTLLFALFSTLLVGWNVKYAPVFILVCFLVMGSVMMMLCYRYFQEEHHIMENTILQIREYLSGNKDITIDCSDEGELYRLFHEVNSLVAILNAHAENEKNTKLFLKNTISDISHQLKTPLSALNIYVGLIQDEAQDIPSVREFSLLSEQELDRIETLVQNLLKITKLDAGTIVIEKATENVSEMMGCIEKQFAYRAEQEGKRLILSGDDTVTFSCDRIWLLEAVGNVVKNAFDHTDKGAEIRIEWCEFASIVQIVVRDNGKGIHPEDLPHIFKRFYRSRFSKDTQGIGLGLPLAKAITEAHSGTIEVDSELGAGTTFTMNFLCNCPAG